LKKRVSILVVRCDRNKWSSDSPSQASLARPFRFHAGQNSPAAGSPWPADRRVSAKVPTRSRGWGIVYNIRSGCVKWGWRDRDQASGL